VVNSPPEENPELSSMRYPVEEGRRGGKVVLKKKEKSEKMVREKQQREFIMVVKAARETWYTRQRGREGNWKS